ncbi:MAG: class I SAM-dependent methyltransferase [Gammaproteobacteria bacterium]|jgi:methyltransferase-like protein
MSTLVTYDAIPYEDCPITETHPDYLCIVSALFGINAAAPDNCRVLELGCAGGGNLIPMAYYWPDSTFIGIELSEKQAAQGNAIIEELGLENISLVHKDILQLDRSIGSFDYIIVHGVFSWVPRPVQDYILKLCRLLLRKNGVAYISYNTFPGWHFRAAVRDMMLHHSRKSDSPKRKLDKSIELLHILSRGLPSKGRGSLSEQWLKQEADKLLAISPGYLLHDYLEPNNQPMYFHEFAQRIGRHQLKYLAEAHLYTMLGSTLTQHADAELNELDDLIEYEQYLDYFYLRHFRQTLICHGDNVVERDLAVDKLRDCYVFALLTSDEEIDLFSTEAQSFNNRIGSSFDISHPLTKAAIIELARIYPSSYSYDALLTRARELLAEIGSEYQAVDGDDLLEELFHLFLSRAVQFSMVKRGLQNTVAEKPKANTLSRVYNASDKCCFASAHHISIQMNYLDRYIISLLTGQNDITQIESNLLAKAENDTAFLRCIEKATEFMPLKDYLEQTIYHFAVHGLLDYK